MPPEPHILIDARVNVTVPIDVLGKRKLSAEISGRAAQYFNASVVSAYGLSETGLVAYQCAHGRFHIDRSACYVEQDGPSGAGTAELIVSTLLNPAMPLLRYRTGDSTLPGQTQCACGRSDPGLVEIAGRIVPTFRTAAGAPVSPSQLFRNLPSYSKDLIEYRVDQLEPGRFAVTIETRAVDRAEFARQIAARLNGALDGVGSASVILDEIPRGDKFQRYRDLSG
ncbi:hypothetical protein HFN59_00525 [Rhizobium leguminosarum]|uniref:hypothetical protein n=1 Tax=Rhizobium leguminosarum TaxID=384 RepID=UPI001C987E64|nr:hypothetical protein [Rhizobium leguminosarum]MBY5775613.1 hypothetical protein [Rhizobium leguminosarum]